MVDLAVGCLNPSCPQSCLQSCWCWGCKIGGHHHISFAGSSTPLFTSNYLLLFPPLFCPFLAPRRYATSTGGPHRLEGSSSTSTHEGSSSSGAGAGGSSSSSSNDRGSGSRCGRQKKYGQRALSLPRCVVCVQMVCVHMCAKRHEGKQPCKVACAHASPCSGVCGLHFARCGVCFKCIDKLCAPTAACPQATRAQNRRLRSPPRPHVPVLRPRRHFRLTRIYRILPPPPAHTSTASINRTPPPLPPPRSPVLGAGSGGAGGGDYFELQLGASGSSNMAMVILLVGACACGGGCCSTRGLPHFPLHCALF